MLRALKDLVPDLEKVVKLQYVSQLLHIKLTPFMIYVTTINKCIYSVCLFVHFHTSTRCSSEEAKATKKVCPDIKY